MARLELERGTDVLLLETGDSLLLEPNDPIVPATLALAITTYAPVVEVTDTSVVTPSTLALTINTFAPAVLTPQTVTPTTLALTITAYVPTIELPIVSAPSLLELSITTYAPTVSFTENVFIIPTTASITLTTYAPIVTATDTKVVTPSLVELVLSTFAPTATVSNNILVTPTTAILTLLAYAPTVAFLVIYPTDAITRVTSIVHQYRNALINNGRTEYKCLVQLGGLAQFSGIDGMTGVGEVQSSDPQKQEAVINRLLKTQEFPGSMGRHGENLTGDIYGQAGLTGTPTQGYYDATNFFNPRQSKTVWK